MNPHDLASLLVRRAARSAPEALADRLEEEWLADLSERRGPLSRARFALGCCWAMRVIAHEHALASAAAASSTSSHRILVAHAVHALLDPARLSRRTVAIAVLICVHVAVLYIFVMGLAQKASAVFSGPMASRVIEETARREQPPALPQPKFATQVDVPTPLVDTFELPPEAQTITVPPHVDRAVILPPSGVPAAVVNRIVGGPGAGFPSTDDFYPPIARRLGEAGSAVVQVCVDPRGQLTSAPTLAHSSGIRTIDDGALRLARAGSGHYRPTTEDGRPVSACFAYRIRFQLKDLD